MTYMQGTNLCVLASPSENYFNVLVDDEGVLFTIETTKPEKSFKNLSLGEYSLSVDDLGILITDKK